MSVQKGARGRKRVAQEHQSSLRVFYCAVQARTVRQPILLILSCTAASMHKRGHTNRHLPSQKCGGSCCGLVLQCCNSSSSGSWARCAICHSTCANGRPCRSTSRICRAAVQ